MKRSKQVLNTLLVVAILSASLACWQVNRALDAPLTVADGGVVFEIRPGSALSTISNELAEKGILAHPKIFRWYGRLAGHAGSIHAGEYLIETGTSPRTLLDKFVSGDVRLYSFTIVPGWTYRELIEALGANPVVEHSITVEDWPRLLKDLMAPATRTFSNRRLSCSPRHWTPNGRDAIKVCL